MKWIDKKGNKVSQSSCHAGMFIVDVAGGGFYNVHSTVELMKTSHPVKKMIDSKVVQIKNQTFTGVKLSWLLVFIAVLLSSCASGNAIYKSDKKRHATATYR